MVSNAALYSRRHPERLVNPSQSCSTQTIENRPLAGSPTSSKMIYWGSHPAHPHADRKVLPLNVGRADARPIRSSENWDWDSHAGRKPEADDSLRRPQYDGDRDPM